VRKLWYAGAALTGGIILFAASPAQADLLPGTDAAAQQADARLADLLGQSNGLTLNNPLGHSSLKDTAAGKSPVAQFKAGQNSPDPKPLLPGEGDGQRRGLIPGAESARDLDDDNLDLSQDDNLDAQTDDFGSQDDGLDSQDGLGSQDDGLGDETDADDDFGADDPDADVAADPLFGPGALPLLSGLLPSGQVRDFTEQPTALEAERFGGGLPLLGGLGGLLPANSSPRTLPATDEPDVSGMPAGGVAIFPAATPSSATAASSPAASSSAPSSSTPSSSAAPSPAASSPAASSPSAAKPAPGKPAKPQKHTKPAPTATPDDPRLHEEPVETDDDSEAADERPFTSDGRPVAGVDEQYR
jgi:hypothetical protein